MIRTKKHFGFSLIELLLAIFILGVGIISIAALFPAGIAQQQKTKDDVLGPIVARNAMTILRSRLEQEDFGGAELRPHLSTQLSESDSGFEPLWSPELCGFTLSTESINQWPTICGDWMWRRPAIVPSDYGDDGDVASRSVRGAIDIFATSDTDVIENHGPPNIEYWTDTPGLPGIPYNRERHLDFEEQNANGQYEFVALAPPVVRIMAGERQYPMWDGLPEDAPIAQYYWDCMFRRYEGRILVAIFVYRVIDPSQQGGYVVDTTDVSVPDFPTRINLRTEASTGSWNAVRGGEILAGTSGDDPQEPWNQWQFPGQWIIDQNGNVHHVHKGRRRLNDDHDVQLSTQPAELPAFRFGAETDVAGVNVNWWDKQIDEPVPLETGFIREGVVTDIWFVPTMDTLHRRIIPVYATVQEL
jgi:type II secretory pathway pseudopilin PulG